MRSYGLTLYELFLENLLATTALVLLVLSGAAFFFAPAFSLITPADGFRVALVAFCGLLCWLGGAGIRQNQPVSRLAIGLLLLTSGWWIGSGLVRSSGWSLAAGLLLLGITLALWLLFRRATRARFKPRYFSVRQFETLIQVADAVLDSDGEAALSPLQVAVNIDHFLDRFESPVRNDIRMALFLLEWVLPVFTTGRVFPFSMLGSTQRRRVIDQVVGKQGPMGAFRDIARTLKMLTCAGYYGSAEGMAQVGYIPFEQRQRAQGVDQTPLVHPDPFLV